MNIEQFIGELDSIYSLYKDQIVTKNYMKLSDSEVSWPNYRSGIFKNIYIKEYESIIRSRQYSFLLSEDRGCLQFYYLSSGGVIEKIKMAYYPYPVELNTTLDELESLYDDSNDPVLTEYYFDIWNIFTQKFELNIHDEVLKKLVDDSISHGSNESIEELLLTNLEQKYKATNTSHLRVDYDPNVKSHHKCEVQIGAINSIRFPINKLITPLVFTEFIFKNLLRPRQGQKSLFEEISAPNVYKTKIAASKRLAININPFIETNLFLGHN